MDESTPCSLEKKYYKDAMDWYYYLCVMLSRVQFFVTPQTAAHQAPLSTVLIAVLLNYIVEV